MSEALVLKLDEALEEAGWDQPARLYVLAGDTENPTIEPISEELTAHPCDTLREFYAAGGRVPDGAIALALAAEGSRHLSFEELEDQAPQMFATLRHAALSTFKKDELDDDAMELIRGAWTAMCDDTPANLMPEDLRTHVRNSVTVTRSGWTLTVVRDQGGEPEVLDPVPPNRLVRSRVPHYMWLFLMNEEPHDEAQRRPQ